MWLMSCGLGIWELDRFLEGEQQRNGKQRQ
jgi:hypothetical protein